MRDVVRLWFSRLGMMLAAGLLVVGLTWLPAGVVWIEAGDLPVGVVWGVRTEPMQPFIIDPPPAAAPPRAVWSFSQYRTAVLGYLRGLVSGELTDTTWEWRFGGAVEVTYDVLALVRERTLVSLRLLTRALGLGMAAGMVLGLLSLRRGWFRGTSLGLTVAGMAVPDFLAVIMLQLLTIWTHREFGIRLYSVLGPQGGERGWLLPLLALSLGPMAYTARLVVTGLDEVMREPYIRTARAKGLPEARVVVKHGLRNVLGRVFGGLPGMVGIALSSLVVIETLTNVNGLGAALLWGSAYPVVATAGLVFCLWFGLVDGVANTLRILADPRLREGS